MKTTKHMHKQNWTLELKFDYHNHHHHCHLSIILFFCFFKKAADGDYNYFEREFRKASHLNKTNDDNLLNKPIYGIDKLTLLHVAAKHCRLNLIQLFVNNARIDINAKSRYNSTPLHLLIKFYQQPNARILTTTPSQDSHHRRNLSNQQVNSTFIPEKKS
jgi:ankyrin repeat protein